MEGIPVLTLEIPFEYALQPVPVRVGDDPFELKAPHHDSGSDACFLCECFYLGKGRAALGYEKSIPVRRYEEVACELICAHLIWVVVRKPCPVDEDRAGLVFQDVTYLVKEAEPKLIV